jgi:acetyl-CoA C-acetyltransferase
MIGGPLAVPRPAVEWRAGMIVTLVHELRRRQAEYGAATLCGGGQGDALLVRLASR